MNKRICLVLTAIATASIGSARDNEVKPPPIAPARDGNIAIQEELCATRKQGTVSAYDLFIARHPRHPLAEVAKTERAHLISSERPPS